MTKRRAERRAAAAEAEESCVEYSSDDEEESEPLPDRLEELRKLTILTGLLLWATWNLPLIPNLFSAANATLQNL